MPSPQWYEADIERLRRLNRALTEASHATARAIAPVLADTLRQLGFKRTGPHRVNNEPIDEMFCASPLGPDDHTIQITAALGESTGLFTCRAKENEVTAEQLRSIADACTTAAGYLDHRKDPPA